jgi:glyoxylase-like metal-dependent hydrolase (beta-lactamase superfamily II)
MPPQQCARRDDQPDAIHAAAGKEPGQQDQPSSVGPGEFPGQAWIPALGDRELVPQNQDLDVFRCRIPGEQAQPCEDPSAWRRRASLGGGLPVIQRVVTSGTFELDGGCWDVDNNVWVIGDDREAVVIDAAHDAAAIAEAVGERTLLAIVCTHAHNDHINAALALADHTGAPILLHRGDRVLWKQTHTEHEPDDYLPDGALLAVAGMELRVLHTPGHTPGGVCLYMPALGTVFTGDTLFRGGPGATGRTFSDFPTLVDSIRTRLLTLPEETVVRTGHGDPTTIGEEAPHLEEWIARGH